MINTNDFDKGYKDGLEQAREGKKKNFSDFSKLRAFFSSHALDTYIDGVNQGYKDGLREKHLVHKTAPFISEEQRQQIKEQHRRQTETTNRQNIAAQTYRGNTLNPIITNQIETLRNLKAFLNQFNENLQTGSERYQRYLDNLADQQLDAQVYERYQSEFLDETKKRIYDIIENIESNDIPYIERIIAHLEDTPI
jgi:gas vesicle protein